MATAGISLSAELVGLRELQAGLKQALTPPKKAQIMADAIEKAIQPAFRRLYETTPVGPTGNLRAARDYKVVQYPLDGNAVGVLGYRRSGKERSVSAAGGRVRSGPDRAFHQWWIEEGTAPRRVADRFSNTPYVRRAHTRTMKSGVVATISQHEVSGQNAYIASSFNKLGPFKMLPTPRPPRGSGDPHRVQTEPGYPNAFFKKSKTPIVIPPMLPGGRSGHPPLQTAWNTSRAQVAEILTRELRIALSDALSSLTYTGTGTIT